MNRRTRRARRRLRRGDARREPLLLIADDGYPGETLEALARWIYRYRSEIAPLAVSFGLWLAGTILHNGRPGSAPLVGVLAAGIAVGVAHPRVTPSFRRVERVYAAGVATAAGLWLTLAVLIGANAGPMRAALLLATVAGAVPWWGHRRRRARVRVERTLDAWPNIAETIGLPGSRVMSAVVDLWGWRARIGLRRGQTVADVLARVPALESGLGTRPGALRVEPDPARADHCTIRVLDTDPHARALPWPGTPDNEPGTIRQPVPLGLFEDARPVTLSLAHRHGLLGGVAGAGKSGVLNVILASLVTCPDVVLWGIDLKGGMELGPWMSCLDRLATTPEAATSLLAEGVAILEARAAQLAEDGARLWKPTAEAPALVIIIDEYAELSEDAEAAMTYADSIARRGRAVAVTLLVATQRPTQKAMGSGAVRSQMDVRICLRVRERRDVDLILGQGMLAAGWSAHTLDAPGKFLLSTPEQTTPRRARAYLLTDDDVRAICELWARRRPSLDALSANAADSTDNRTDRGEERPFVPRPRRSPEPVDLEPSGGSDDAEAALWSALCIAPNEGASVPDLMAFTGMGRTWVYDRLQDHAAEGRATQVSRGRWRASQTTDTDLTDVPPSPDRPDTEP